MLQAIFPVNLNVADRAISAFNEQDTSREAREAEFSTVTLPFVLQHPLGAGTGTMSSAGAMKVWGGGSATDKLLHKGNIHNGFLQVAIETGWMGLAAYLWLLYAMTMSAYQIHRKSRDPFLRDMGLGLFGVMLFYTIMNFSGPMLTTPLISFDIWALAGLIVLLPQFDEPELPAPAPAPALEAVA